MLKIRFFSGVVLLGLFSVGPTIWADERALTDEEFQVLRAAKTIYIELTTTTWMPRGRTMTLIEPNLRTKMESAGFTVVRDPTDAHDLTLRVEYHEKRGQQIRVDMYVTNITCLIGLEHVSLGPLLRMTIRESSTYPSTGTPPYLEVLEKFEASPYYYFLGDVVRGQVVSRLDTTGGLIEALKRLAPQGPPADDDLGFEHSLLARETRYAMLARENTIHEFGQLKDARAVPVLTSQLRHSRRQVRLLALEALGAIQAAESRPAIERVAQDDKDEAVRQAAAAVLGSLPSSSTVP